MTEPARELLNAVYFAAKLFAEAAVLWLLLLLGDAHQQILLLPCQTFQHTSQSHHFLVVLASVVGVKCLAPSLLVLALWKFFFVGRNR